MLCGFKVGNQLCFGFGRGQEFDLRISVLKGGGVPFLAWRLILLVGLVALTIELLTCGFVLLEIATATFVRFAADNVDT